MKWLISFFRIALWEATGFVSSVWFQVSRTFDAATEAISVVWNFREKPVSVAGSKPRNAPTSVNYFNPVFWVVQIYLAGSRLLASRPWLLLGQGLPALLCLAIPFPFAVWVTPSRVELANEARGKRDFLAKEEKFEQAEYFARKLCVLYPGDASAVFSRAMILEGMQKDNECMDLVRRLIVEYNYVPAIEWYCERELKNLQAFPQADETRSKQLFSLLSNLLERQPNDVKANLMLGTYFLTRNQYASAYGPLLKIRQVSRQSLPEANFSLAVVESQIGRTDDAIRSASYAADGFITRLSREPYSQELSLQVLRSLLLAHREEEAASLIAQWIPIRTESEGVELRWLLGDVYAEWCKRLRTQPRRTAERLSVALEVIYRGIAVAPNNPRVLDELTRLSCSTELEDSQLEKQLNQAMNSGVSPGLVHFILGTRQLIKSSPDVTSAMEHLELAATHNSSLPGLLNNIAEALMQEENVEWDKALTLVDRAIESMPDQPHFFDTRGKVYLGKQQYTKAIADFEKALAAVELRALVHDQLAQAYDGLNNSGEALRQRELAEAYRKDQRIPAIRTGEANVQYAETQKTGGEADIIKNPENNSP